MLCHQIIRILTPMAMWSEVHAVLDSSDTGMLHLNSSQNVCVCIFLCCVALCPPLHSPICVHGAVLHCLAPSFVSSVCQELPLHPYGLHTIRWSYLHFHLVVRLRICGDMHPRLQCWTTFLATEPFCRFRQSFVGNNTEFLHSINNRHTDTQTWHVAVS
jgi:hypothetical protein